MAYSNAVFYLDLYNGNDAVRPALITCIASNPSGTITRITKADHGLVTGAVVTLSLFTTWLNGAWKITVVDTNNFDLDGAVWQTTADNSGTVTPFGGSSWADAWKTNNAGATAARTQFGDKINVCKTPDPVSIGNALWTNGSKEVLLSTPQTKTIDQCESLWTASANVTATREAYPRHQGSYLAKLNIAAGFTTGKVGYYTLSAPLDLSAYQELSLWFMVYLSYAVNNFTIVLCSDTIGNVIVDTFKVPVSMYTHFTSYNLVKEGGGNLGNNIQSIAVYAAIDPGALYVMLDNIIACNTGGLNLNSVISKNGNAQGGDEPYYYIESINEASVLLAGDPYTIPSTWYGYAGVTETVETFLRTPFKVYNNLNANQALNTLSRDGLQLEFGYNTLTDELSGETFLGSANGQQTAYVIKNSTKFTGFLNLCGFNYGISGSAISNCNIKLHGCISVRYNSIGLSGTCMRHILEIDYMVACNEVALTNVYNSKLTINKILSTRLDGIILNQSDWNEIYLSVVKYVIGSSATIRFVGSSNNKVYGGIIDLQKAFSVYSGVNSVFDTRCDNIISNVYIEQPYTGGEIRWINRDGNGSHEVYKYQMIAKWQTIEKYLTEPGALELRISISNTATELFPIYQEIGEINFNADLLVTITIPVKKSQGTALQTQLVGKRNSIVGINEDIKVTKANDTNWELLTIQFTPTSKGVIKLVMHMWTTHNADTFVFVGKIQATQA